MGKVEERKAKLHEALINEAEAEISAGGIAALKARSLAQAVGCSVGAIYNIFDDLDALAMTVNARTFRRLGRHVSEKVAAHPETTPTAQMIAMSLGYLEFAVAETNLWRAIFEVEMPADEDVPEWYQDELRVLFGLIAEPVGEVFPDMGSRERSLMVRALFSAVHGIVLLGLERRISAVPQEHIETMIVQVIGQIGK